eukprot:PhF_6_TR538/c1_g1_i1/m.419
MRFVGCLFLLVAFSEFVFCKSNPPNPNLNPPPSIPISSDGHYVHNKYSVQSAIQAEEVVFGTDTSHRSNGTAKYGLGISWVTELGSSVYATPTITDLFSDGRKEIIIPTFTHYLEVIDGQVGDDVKGWPFTHPELNTHSSVLMVDLDADGTQEMMYSSERGELLFFEESGRAMVERTIRIPPLRVLRKWYKLSANADENHEKHMYEMMVKRHQELGTPHRKWGPEWQQFRETPGQPPLQTDAPVTPEPIEERKDIPHPNLEKAGQPHKRIVRGGRKLHQMPDESAPDPLLESAKAAEGTDDPSGPGTGGYPDVEGGDYYDEDMYTEGIYGKGGVAPASPGTDGWLSQEARESMDLIFHTELFQKAEKETRKLAVPEDLLFVPDTDFRVKYNNDDPANKDHVYVDAHILATPVVADLELDGSLEAILSVTYFFDQEYYRRNNITLPDDVDPDNYVAGGVVVVNILTGTVKWSQQLDLSTENVKYKANVYSSPVVADIDRDGVMEVIVSTSMGFIYVFNSLGSVRKGWPKVMGEIQANVLVEDIDGDGVLDICAADFKSNVVCFNADGKSLWEARVSGGVAQAMVAGDVNADGEIDIVFGSTTGHVWALNGRTGQTLPHFPFKCRGRIYAPVTLVRLESKGVSSYGLHIVVLAHDGFLYVIDGEKPSLYEKLDIGETSYSMVLSDDLNNNGYLDFVVTTMNGNVYLVETKTPWHPLKAWTSFPHGINVVSAREGVGLGIYVSKESRAYRDVVGDHFKILFHIQDNRPAVTKGRLAPTYHVVIKIGHRMIAHSATYSSAGTYVEFVSTPLQRMYSTVIVMLLADNSQVFVDQFSLSFNMHFHTSMKWAFLIPFVALTVALMYVRKSDSLPDEEELLMQYYRSRLSPQQPVRNQYDSDEEEYSPSGHQETQAQRL